VTAIELKQERLSALFEELRKAALEQMALIALALAIEKAKRPCN